MAGFWVAVRNKMGVKFSNTEWFMFRVKNMNNEPQMYYMVRDIRTGGILARNGKWMKFSAYGNLPSSYKVYKSKKRCQNKVDSYNQWRLLNDQEPILEMLEMHNGLRLGHDNKPVMEYLHDMPDCDCQYCVAGRELAIKMRERDLAS